MNLKSSVLLMAGALALGGCAVPPPPGPYHARHVYGAPFYPGYVDRPPGYYAPGYYHGRRYRDGEDVYVYGEGGLPPGRARHEGEDYRAHHGKQQPPGQQKPQNIQGRGKNGQPG